MGTPLQKVYDAFLAKNLDDEWDEVKGWTESLTAEDFEEILNGAIPYFKFPRTDLSFTGCVPAKYDDKGDEISSFEEGHFTESLSNNEIQILATYMKVEWLNRTILTWENVKPLYYEKDFSQANLIDKFRQLLEHEEKKALRLESIYYRSVNGKSFKYGRLAEQ